MPFRCFDFMWMHQNFTDLLSTGFPFTVKKEYDKKIYNVEVLTVLFKSPCQITYRSL